MFIALHSRYEDLEFELFFIPHANIPKFGEQLCPVIKIKGCRMIGTIKTAIRLFNDSS